MTPLPPDPNPDPKAEQFAELMEAYLAGSLSEEEIRAFEDALLQSPQYAQQCAEALQSFAMVRETFRETAEQADVLTEDPTLQSFHDLLQELGQAEARAEVETISLDTPPAKAKQKDDAGSLSAHDLAAVGGYVLRHALTSKAAIYAYAAAIVLLTLVLLNPWGNNETPTDAPFATDNPNMPAASTESTPRGSSPVATLTASHNAHWAEGDLSPGSDLQSGQKLTLTQGFAEITTARGAVAILQAPATVEFLNNDNAIQLHSGKLVGICETDSSKGFLVRTPHLDVTDLGTRFGISADADATEVHVFEGEVQAERVDTAPDAQPILLVANQSARTSADSDTITRIDHDADQFATLLPDTIQLPGTGVGLAVGDTDPNWQVVAIDGQPLDTPQLLRVTSNRYYNGQFANDPATSQWLSFTPAEQTGEEHAYQVRTAIDLPQDISENGARLRLTYMADNALRSVTVNGHRVVLPEIQWTDGRNGYAPFQHATIDRHLVSGTNTFVFELVNIAKRGTLSDTGLRVAWELSAPSAQPDRTQPSPR